jgi:hypothetical protein
MADDDADRDDGPAWGPGIFLLVAGVALLWMGFDLCTGGAATRFAAGLLGAGAKAEGSGDAGT